MQSRVPDDGHEGRRTDRWLAKLVPESVARAVLGVTLAGPDRVVVGTDARFRLTVRNRLPIPVAITLPSARTWGWAVDGVPDADERTFELPEAERLLHFGPRERRTFTWTWDGRIRTSGDRWAAVVGEHSTTGFLAVAEDGRDAVRDRTTVRVVDRA